MCVCVCVCVCVLHERGWRAHLASSGHCSRTMADEGDTLGVVCSSPSAAEHVLYRASKKWRRALSTAARMAVVGSARVNWLHSELVRVSGQPAAARLLI